MENYTKIYETMKIYKNTNVYEEALNRIRFLFDEFEEVIVGVSGGKDSTVIYELCKIVAKEKNRLPIKVLFIDQEAEWQSTIEIIKSIMYDKDVIPLWLQIPMRLFNATSTEHDWLYCWNEEDKKNWIREKDPISIKENKWGTDRFKEFFDYYIKTEYKDIKACYISGVRAEESPNRAMTLTNHAKYKWITWGKKFNKNNYTFYPIYDWKYTDVWKAIQNNKWEYNRIYDYQYQYGIGIMDMRVSNLHHETALKNIFYLQEAEPDTYQKIVNRLQGIDTAGKLGKDDYFVYDLPYMFKSWREYRDYLLDKLIKPDKKEYFIKQFKELDTYVCCVGEDIVCKSGVQILLANDWTGTKKDNLRNRWNLNLRDYKRKLGLL